VIGGQTADVQRIRVLCPPRLTPQILGVLETEPGLAHLVVLTGVARKPVGDQLEADLARESVAGVIDRLPDDDDLVVTIEELTATISVLADEAEADAPGEGDDAVVWAEVESRTDDDSQPTVSYFALLVVAVLLANVGIVTDSSVLVVGSMVIGPDFGPISGLTLATIQRRLPLARRALTSLFVGFPIAIAAAFVLTLVAKHAHGLPASYLAGHNTLTSFASQPGGWSLITALLAGVAGTLSLTSAKASALVGVAVSVTTVPAAAAIGAGVAAQHWGEFRGGLGQLLLNLVALYVAGLVSLGIRHGARTRRRHAES
jgi:uncharacterized hydrophobic protein (TIGR00271 family)